MNFNYINNIVNENHNNYINYNIINNEINYNELKHISIKTFNNNFYQLKKYEKNFNINVIKKIYNQSDYNLKIKILFNCPDFYTIILNDFTKFIFELVQKTRKNICSLIYNYCYKDGYKKERLPEYKYHYYLTYNKESCLFNWFNEYNILLNDHLNNNLNDELYTRQTNILIKLVEIKTELKEKKELADKSINDDNLELEKISIKDELETIKEDEIELENISIKDELELEKIYKEDEIEIVKNKKYILNTI